MKSAKIILAISLAIILSCGIGVGVYTYTTSVNAEMQNQNEFVAVASVAVNKQVQQRLKNWGYYKGEVDGIIGPLSKAAIKSFQKKNGLVVDGIIGPKTLAAIGISASTTTSSSSKYSSNDVYLVAKCVHAEARGEPYTGQVAVAAVILNRVKSPSFPNTISGVIYQPWAFTAVNDGQMKLEPNDSAYKAAKDAMSGWDPSYGSLYYYNPVTATSKWIWSRKTVVTIGKHVFAL